MVARNGIAGNWLWWNMAASGMLTVFFYARLWRRAGVMTDVEFAELRYAGKPAAFLRGFRALYLGIPINCIIIGWVNLAMVKILQVTLGLDAADALWVLVAMPGVHRVLHHDLPGCGACSSPTSSSSSLKMGMVMALAFYAVRAIGGLDALQGQGARARRRAPAAARGSPSSRRLDSAWMPAITLFVYLGVQLVGELVSGRRAGRRRLRRPAHLLGEERAARRCSRRSGSTSRTTRCGRGRGS